MIIDAHMHINFDQEKHSNSEAKFFNHVENVIKQMKNNSISAGILAQGLPLDFLEKVLNRYPEWFKGLLPIGDDMDLNHKNIDNFKSNPNIIGIKIYPNVFKNSEIIDKIQPLLVDIKENNWIVQVHSNPVVKSDLGIPLEIVELAYKTDISIVMVHSGGHQFQQLSSWVNHPPENLYFDTSAVQNIFAASPYLPHLKWFLNQIPEDRLFWGSDFPDDSFEEALNSFKMLDFAEEKANNVLANNILKLLKNKTDTDLEIINN